MSHSKKMTCFMCNNACKAYYNGHGRVKNNYGCHKCHEWKAEFNAEVTNFESHCFVSSKERLVSVMEVLSVK